MYIYGSHQEREGSRVRPPALSVPVCVHTRAAFARTACTCLLGTHAQPCCRVDVGPRSGCSLTSLRLTDPAGSVFLEQCSIKPDTDSSEPAL